MIKIQNLSFCITLFILCIASSNTTFAKSIHSSSSSPTSNDISSAQVTKDITYLASDELKGRGNFSSELNHAAHFIAKRFIDSGLIGTNGITKQDMLQTYYVNRITPSVFTLKINDETIATKNLAIASTANSITWNISNGIKNNNFSLHQINKNDDMKATLSKLNNQGGNHLILINLTHQKLFQRYQQYFQRGVTKLVQDKNASSQGGTVAMLLTQTTVDEVINLNMIAESTKVTHELTNVVAVLPGKTKPNEVVLYSAHFDHLGFDSADQNDNIYNGADDNASGTTAIINIAQYYATQNNNARTLMFAAFSAEEIGGFGSQYFSKQLDPETITAMINIEMIGKPSKFGAGTLWMTGMERSNLGEQLNKALTNQNKKIHQDPYPDQNLFYRSDNATLAKLGVPAHSFSSTQLDKDQHYHQVSDDLSSLNLPSLHKVIQTLTEATKPLVDGSVTPTRIDTSKVKAKGLIF